MTDDLLPAVEPGAVTDASERSSGEAGTPPASSAGAPGVIVPDWLVNLTALGWRLVAIAALGVVLWLLSSLLWTVTASIAVAIVVSALFAPWVLRLRARGWSRARAAGTVWVTALVSITAVLVILAIAFLPYVDQLLGELEADVAKLQASLEALNVPAAGGTVVKDLLDATGIVTGDFVAGIVASVTGIVTVMILATFLVFFFLRDGDKAWMWVFQGLGPHKRERITAAGDDALVRVGGYLRGTTVLSGIIALTDLVFLLVLGVPLAGPLSVLVFLSGYIPYFGGIITTALILIVTVATQGTTAGLILLVLIGIRNMILGYGVRPTVYGRTVSVHPALVLIALPAGFQLAGVVGLFAAVPATAVLLAVASATAYILEPDPPPPLPGLVPAWLDRTAQWSWRLLVGFALVALVIAVFVAVPLVVIPVVLALILAATVAPVVRALVRRGRSRGRAAAITVGGGALVIVTLVGMTIVALAGEATQVVSQAVAGATSVDTAAGGNLGLLVRAVIDTGDAVVATVATIAQSVSSVLVISVLATLLAFYMLRDGSGLWDRLLTHVRPGAEDRIRGAGSRAFEVLGGYMSGTAAISFVGAGSQLLIMLLLGIPLALPVFVLSFFLCFIPYIGGFVSTGIALLLTIATGSPSDVAIMVVWTLLFNLVTGNIVSPIVYGRTVHIHPAIVLVAIPAGAAIAGVLGMFFVVPALGVVAATWRAVLSVMGSPGPGWSTPAEPSGPTARAGAQEPAGSPESATGSLADTYAGA
jgi:predicted PurR-regulated permease PerM